MYPTISNASFSLLNCQTLDDGNSYLKKDYSIQCWVGEHKRIGVSIALVMIFFWVIGFPVYIFYELFNKRKSLNNKDVVLGYGLFFVGLSEKAFFWEVVVTNLRKIIFVICSTILSSIDPVYKVCRPACLKL
jgi:hypothetical protein